jgi:phage gpG-like protein
MPSSFVLQGVEELQRVAGNYSKGRAMINALLEKACKKFALAAWSTSMNKYMSKSHKGERKNDSDILRVQSEQLRSHVYADVEDDGDGFLIRLGVDNIPYAAIHEYGGVILRKGKHGTTAVTMRERSYLRRAIKDTIGPFTEDVTAVILGAAKAGFQRGEF